VRGDVGGGKVYIFRSSPHFDRNSHESLRKRSSSYREIPRARDGVWSRRYSGGMSENPMAPARWGFVAPNQSRIADGRVETPSHYRIYIFPVGKVGVCRLVENRNGDDEKRREPNVTFAHVGVFASNERG
jgi:hypothetical protein